MDALAWFDVRSKSNGLVYMSFGVPAKFSEEDSEILENAFKHLSKLTCKASSDVNWFKDNFYLVRNDDGLHG